jgi:hypothetical protein
MFLMKAKPQSEEYRAFENLLGKVLSVSKTELNQRIAQEKAEKQPTVPASPGAVSPSKRT